jgi:hypothetical protein
MSENRRNNQHRRHQSVAPAKEHGSTAEETAALNETLKSFSEKYYEPDEKKERREGIKFGMEIALAGGVALNIALTAGLLITGAMQADYSGRQVEASQAQLKLMQDTETRQLRAYAHITPGISTVTGPPEGPIEIAVRPGVKVFGQTPARGIVVPWAIVVDDWPIGDTFKFTYLNTSMQSTTSVGPGDEKPVDAKSKSISKDDVAQINSGKKRVYAYGTVLYADVFRKARYTNFCWVFDIPGLFAKTGSDCPIHNGADWNNSAEPVLSLVNVPMK